MLRNYPLLPFSEGRVKRKGALSLCRKGLRFFQLCDVFLYCVEFTLADWLLLKCFRGDLASATFWHSNFISAGVIKVFMVALMVIVSVVITFPVFLLFVYGLGRVIFTDIEKAEQQQVKEKQLLLMKAKRVKKIHRVQKARTIDPRYLQEMPLPAVGYKNRPAGLQLAD